MKDDPGGTGPAYGRAPRAGEIERVLVAADLEKPQVGELLGALEPFLRERGVEVVVEGRVRSFDADRAAEVFAPRPGSDTTGDLALVLGGDGALLGVIRALCDRPIPTLGINFGRVGFLASVPAGRWRPALERLFDGHGVVEPRMRMIATLERAEQPPVRLVALNDAVVSRSPSPGVMTVELHVGGRWVADYRADGLILATPSGSTAHSLSAGGPILADPMNGLVATPICPMALSYRPIVLSADHEVEVRLQSSPGGAILVADGQGFHPLDEGDRVCIERHPVPFPLLSWEELDPYRRLRSRLGWTQHPRGAK